MTTVAVALYVVLVLLSVAVLAWCVRAERRKRQARDQAEWTKHVAQAEWTKHVAQAEWTKHVAQAVAVVQVPQCEAIVDRRRRLPDPARCAHLRPGVTAFALRTLGGEDIQLCSACFATSCLVVRDVHELQRNGVPHQWARDT